MTIKIITVIHILRKAQHKLHKRSQIGATGVRLIAYVQNYHCSDCENLRDVQNDKLIVILTRPPGMSKVQIMQEITCQEERSFDRSR